MDKQSWDKRTIELKGSILQSWAWGEFLQSQGKKIHRIAGEDHLLLAAEIALPLGKKYLYCPRGPVGDIEEGIAAMTKLLESDRAVIFAKIEPAIRPDLIKADKDVQPSHNWVLDLDKSEPELLAGMKPKHRYNLSLAQRKGLKVREAGRDDLERLYRLLSETGSRNNFRLHPKDYYWQLFECLYPDHLRLLVAELEGEMLAGMFMTVFSDTAVYLHGGSSQVHKEMMAPYLLHWEAIRLAKGLALTRYDFGGVAPLNEADHPWAGITRFKKGFGGNEEVFPGSFDFVSSRFWYNVYRQVRKFRSYL